MADTPANVVRWAGRTLRDGARTRMRALRNRGRTFQPVFVAGAMGSGTTLLAMLLGQRFDSAGVVTESARQIAKRSFLYVPRLRHFASVPEYQAALAPHDGWSTEQGRADLQDLYRAYAEREGELIFDKGPNANLVRIGFLLRCFPDARCLLIHRDPAVNIEGFRRKWPTFGNAPLDECIAFYDFIHRRFLDDTRDARDRVLGIRYESLVEDDAAVLGAIGDWLSLAPAKSALRMEERANVSGRGLRNVQGGEIRVVRDANRSSASGLPDADRSRIEDALGGLAADLADCSPAV